MAGENREIIFHNKSSNEASIAIAYCKNGSWISIGWLNVKATASLIYPIGIYNYDKIFWYAHSSNAQWIGPDAGFCIDYSNAFEISNQDNDAIRVGFFALKITGKITEHTLTN